MCGAPEIPNDSSGTPPGLLLDSPGHTLEPVDLPRGPLTLKIRVEK